MKKYMFLGLTALTVIAAACNKPKQENKTTEEKNTKTENITALKEALTFYASFNGSTDADIALGDNKLYRSPVKSADSATLGLKPDVKLLANGGLSGSGALRFTERSKGYIFYPAEGNIAYSKASWNGAVSFWLSLDPATDLEPGFCDPIQITDVSYNDAAIWVDFTKENPRQFRLGVIPDRAAWNPTPQGPDNENPVFIAQLPVVENLPFGKDKWTHVLINYQGLNTGNGTATLFLDGKPAGATDSIPHPFTWQYDRANIYLGLSYIGLMDELSIYNRALTDEEVSGLHNLKGGLKGLLK